MATIRTGNVSSALIIGGSVSGSTISNLSPSSANRIFDDLRSAIGSISVESERLALMVSIDKLEISRGKPGFLDHYKSFMQLAANHISVVSPFISTLSSMLT